jgi:hypothetical protein
LLHKDRNDEVLATQRDAIVTRAGIIIFSNNKQSKCSNR